jgi:4-hydroxy-3-polyprenylbenzoate decarboxylase
MKKIVVGITGASGVIYGVRTLEVLSQLGVETHLVISPSAVRNLEIETEYSIKDLQNMASCSYDFKDISESISSGSFHVDGMIVAPCSIKTLSAIANSYNENLLVRAADVTLKERRRLLLIVRETPLHEGHLELMMRVTRMGGVIMPPVPAFYHMPKTVDDIINQTVGKALDLFAIDAKLFSRWGVKAPATAARTKKT